MSRKVLSLALLIVLLTLSACAAPVAAPAEDSGAATADDSAEKTQIDVWLLVDSISEPLWEQFTADFNEANPDVEAVLTLQTNETYKTAIQVALASNDPPDVYFNWPGDDAGRMVREGNALNLDQYAEEYGWHDSLAAAPLDAFTIDGSLYGMPYSLHSKFFYYNTQIFDELGLEEPETFDELLALCTTLRENDIVPLSFGNGERWQGVHYISILNQKMAGEDATNADYTLTNSAEELFTSPGYVQALEKLTEMRDAGCFADAPNATLPVDAWAQFYSGAVAMTYGGTWTPGIFDENGFEGQYSFFPMPVTDGAGTQTYFLMGPDGIQVSAKTEHPDAAVAFVNDFVSKVHQEQMVEVLNRPPVRDVDVEGMSDVLTDTIAQINAAEGATLWLDVVLENSISEVYLNGIQEVLSGDKTPEQVVEEVRAQALKMKEELGR